jgi:hypothetical protein
MGYIHKPKQKFKCANCGSEFESSLSFSRFCSKQCSIEFHNKKIKKSSFNKITPGLVEVISEFLVCEDLIKLDYNIYRAVSRSSDAQLVIVKGTLFYKVKISTGTYANGKLLYRKSKLKEMNLAVVTHSDRKIHYINFTP